MSDYKKTSYPIIIKLSDNHPYKIMHKTYRIDVFVTKPFKNQEKVAELNGTSKVYGSIKLTSIDKQGKLKALLIGLKEQDLFEMSVLITNQSIALSIDGSPIIFNITNVDYFHGRFTIDIDSL